MPNYCLHTPPLPMQSNRCNCDNERGVNAMQKSSTEPILEEFLPLKKNSDAEKVEAPKDEIGSNSDKMNWMSSVQIRNSDNQNPCRDIEFSKNKKALKQNNKRV